MLRVEPKMPSRLGEIETDLLLRRERAETEGRLGGLEGLDLTLDFLRGKRAEATWLNRAGPADPGMPILPGATK